MPEKFEMSMEEYCEKWNRRREFNPALILMTHSDCNVKELLEFYEKEPIEGYMEIWLMTDEQEYYDAFRTAITEKMRQDETETIDSSTI